MLVVIAQDDSRPLPLARQAAAESPAVYGTVYMAFHDQMPQLATGENLSP